MIDEAKLIDELYALADKESRKCDEAAEANLTDIVVKYNHGESCYFNAVEAVNSQPKIGGWIPCGERLPEDGVDVLVWFEYFRYGEYNRLFQAKGISYAFDGRWSGFVNGSTGWHQLRIIAWQPLPEDYHE